MGLRAHWRTYVMVCAGPVVLALALIVLNTNLTPNGHPAKRFVPLLRPHVVGARAAVPSQGRDEGSVLPGLLPGEDPVHELSYPPTSS